MFDQNEVLSAEERRGVHVDIKAVDVVHSTSLDPQAIRTASRRLLSSKGRIGETYCHQFGETVKLSSSPLDPNLLSAW